MRRPAKASPRWPRRSRTSTSPRLPGASTRRPQRCSRPDAHGAEPPMSAAEPPQIANSAPSGGSEAAKPRAWGDHTSALATVAAFEFRTRIRRISTWVYFAIFGALAMLWIAAAGGAISGAIVSFGSGKVWIDSPYAIAQTFGFLGMASLTVLAAVMGRAIQQDFEYRAEAFFFTAPIPKAAYLGGRFVGAVAVLVVILSSIPIGSALGLLLPGI